MNTLRSELEKMGPERVRRAMVAFEHRKKSGTMFPDTCGGICCFVSHAYGAWGNCEFRMDAVTGHAFENQRNSEFSRADLHAECVAYLAEHGSAVGPRVLRGATQHVEVGTP